MFAKCAAAATYCLIAALTPAQASSACMTYAEARQTFRTSHLYWHGKDHCWDSSAVATKHASMARPVRRPERPTLMAATATPSNETPTIGLASAPANPGELQLATALPELRQWSDTMAMAQTIETTPWINRWPDQPLKPPSRPVVAEAVANAALAASRGLVAGIMVLVLSLALLEIVFGGTELRTRLMFGRKERAPRWRWPAARRGVPNPSGSPLR